MLTLYHLAQQVHFDGLYDLFCILESFKQFLLITILTGVCKTVWMEIVHIAKLSCLTLTIHLTFNKKIKNFILFHESNFFKQFIHQKIKEHI